MRSVLLPIAIVAIALSPAANAASVRGTDVIAMPGTLAGKTGSAGNASPIVQTGGVLAPLTASECTGLGGKVIVNTVCNSKNSCKRTDENGMVHEVCLSVQ